MSARIGNDTAEAWRQQIELKRIGTDEYESVNPPGRMGNSKPIAYGGCTTAVALYAAYQTINRGFNLYSVLGFFLGPSLIDRPLVCKVFRTRETKSFSTRRVVLSQQMDDGSLRRCLELTADFQLAESSVLYRFSPDKALEVSGPDDAPTPQDLRKTFAEKGHVDPHKGAAFDDTFALMARFWEWRPCIEGISGQNLSGLAKHLPTTQDDRHITNKVSSEWQRARGDVGGVAEQMAALAFNMDGGLAFLPLMHDHRFLDDAGACSSLDFALRIFTDDLQLSQWHLKERRVISAEGGRTYSEARLFDLSGRLVAIESQQSIMRAPKAATANTKL